MNHPGRPVILMEFNELSPVLIDRFISQGVLPNFRKLRDQSHCYVTDAQAQYPNLEPWIQWTTVHSGLNYQDHGIIHLDEGHKFTRKYVWEILSEAGLPVWICGAMNARYEAGLNGAVLPDPWASKTEPYPRTLAPFYNFVKRNVQEHTNENARFTSRDYLSFASFMMHNGLSPRTVKSIGRQLLAERTKAARWRRATLLDQLQLDVFKHFYQKLRPNLSIFFSNSTAHFQHMYWRNMDPGPFKVKPTPEEQAAFGDAILFGYNQMDGLIGQFLELATDDAILILVTALSQQPYLTYEDKGGKYFYRPHDYSSFLDALGIEDHTEVSPVMAGEFYVRFRNEESAKEGERILNNLMLGERSVFGTERRANEVFCGCSVHTKVDSSAMIRWKDSGRTVPFSGLLFRVEGLKSGMHHPEGVLWISYPDRKHQRSNEKVPLVNLAPTLLDFFSVPQPDYMSGQSLYSNGSARL